MVFSGAEIRKVSGVSNWQCCDECGKTAGCAAYSWVAATSECSLKWFAGSATAKDGVVSAELKDVAANDKCPTQQKNMVFSGAEIRKVSGVSNWQCCDECGKTAGCAAYSWVAATSECSLKWFAGSATAMDGVVSAELKDVAANDKCPTQQKNMVFSGAEIRKVSGVSNWQCCDECGKTAGCAAYSWVAATSECSLKWFAGSATAKDGVVSAELKDVAANDKCPTQQKNMVFSGAEIRKVSGVSNWQCCDECGKTAGCAAYSWVAATSECSLKWFAGSATAKDGVVSAELKDVAANDKCPTQQKNMVFSGAEIRKVSGVSNWQCCDECGKTAGCAAYSWVAATSECSLKWFAGSATAKDGVVSAELKDVAANDKCPTQQKNMVFSGAEIRKVSGVSNWQCCDECGKTAGCAAYSWVAATSECSLKWFAGSATAKDGVVSAELKDVGGQRQVSDAAEEHGV
ncbi:hypothetical protein PINS_up021767 [Pythium insidiosum]|nr:hypothetical protein PINS_up021767 [Pythium insidiosum]